MHFSKSAVFSLLTGLASAGFAPDRTSSGLNLVFHETFPGAAGSPPNDTNWNIALGVHTNNEQQTYTSSNQNMQISGGGTFQIVPRKDDSGSWTSGRIETKGTYVAPTGGVLQIESSLRLGWNPQGSKKGMWPAFWTMGDAIHHGTEWPQCGELDIMEQLNGEPIGRSTVHCDQFPGGACNEPSGLGSTTTIDDDVYHTWALRVDVTNSDWTQQIITWFKDGEVIKTLTGAQIGDQAVWGTLAHSPLFIILNVAVGGDWPGDSNSATMDGYGSMMEIEYVAVYSS